MGTRDPHTSRRYEPVVRPKKPVPLPPQYWNVSGGPVMGHQRTRNVGEDISSGLYSNCTVLCLCCIHSHSVTSLSRGTFHQSTILASRPACSRSLVVVLTSCHALLLIHSGQILGLFTAGTVVESPLSACNSTLSVSVSLFFFFFSFFFPGSFHAAFFS